MFSFFFFFFFSFFKAHIVSVFTKNKFSMMLRINKETVNPYQTDFCGLWKHKISSEYCRKQAREGIQKKG